VAYSFSDKFLSRSCIRVFGSIVLIRSTSLSKTG